MFSGADADSAVVLRYSRRLKTVKSTLDTTGMYSLGRERIARDFYSPCSVYVLDHTIALCIQGLD